MSSSFIISIIRIVQGYPSFLSGYLNKILRIKKNQNKELINNEENLGNKDINKLSENLSNCTLIENDFIDLEMKILQNVI